MATWNDSDEESINKNQTCEILNLALMVVGGEPFDELNKVNILPFYDELFAIFQELHSDLKKINLKSVF